MICRSERSIRGNGFYMDRHNIPNEKTAIMLIIV